MLSKLMKVKCLVSFILCIPTFLCSGLNRLIISLESPKVEISLLPDAQADNMTFLLSEVHSGNTWCRYLIECLTKIPTMQFTDLKKRIANRPLGVLFENVEVELCRPKIWKCHSALYIERVCHRLGKKLDVYRDRLVFILRDYKECLPSRFYKSEKIKAKLLESPASYFENLRIYANWDPNNKLLIRYKDLVLHPEKVIDQLAEFFNITDFDVYGFMENIDFHRDRVRDLYKNNFGLSKSVEKGYNKDSMTYQQKRFPAEFWEEIDVILSKRYPDLWKIYKDVLSD